MIEALHHIGIAVENLDDAVRIYRDQLGLRLDSIEEVPTERVRVAVLFAGATRIELLEPTGDDSPIAKALAKRGPGVHHIAFQVADASDAVRRLDAAGLQVLDDAPRPGAHGSKCAFIHPKSLGGVLGEIVEPAR
ncbi:MAG TPA: methylmalonyl-CoA epimerase [Planctomycetota bacterium]|nr:methylmalonyl-CoA epimerase [Planctomycetota bacterium]